MTTPLCKIFGQCGGCAYQDLPYEEELRVKLANLKAMLREKNVLGDELFHPVTASPKPYFYRQRLDLTLRKSRGEWKLGYIHPIQHYLIEPEQCPIAREEINAMLPGLKAEATATIPEKYKNANLVVRTDDSGKVRWGGIGRHSLRMQPEDYFFTVVKGVKVFYSLETFFQANLSILDLVMDKLTELETWNQNTVFFDLYSGVGLFGLVFANRVGQVIMIEESPASDKIARYNVSHHNMGNVRVLDGSVEKHLPVLAESFASPRPSTQSGEGAVIEPSPRGRGQGEGWRKIALIDPPRKGLSPSVIDCLNKTETLPVLFYLSCSPESLARDLHDLTVNGDWKVDSIHPFDFFPRTSHLETLVKMVRPC